jgi:hypothetical protein
MRLFVAFTDSEWFAAHASQSRVDEVNFWLFRILVTDACQRQCALTGERTLPVLDAAHIKPYSVIQRKMSNKVIG